MKLSDSALTQKVKEGDHHAFKKIFYLYSVKLCKLAYSITKNKHASEDIVQDFFISYWLKREILVFNPTFLSYAYRSVYNASLNYLRDNKKEIHGALEETYHIAGEEESLSIEKEHLGSKLESAIGQLPPRCKEVFLMAKVDKKSYAEIASELNISENTVKAQVSKAYKIIRDHSKIISLIFSLTFVN